MTTTTVQQAAQRSAYYEAIGNQYLVPLWTRLHHLVTPLPQSSSVPHLWRYQATREALLKAGSLITAEEAERRVLVLENPGLLGSSRITTSLYAGLQLVLPGELAGAHRHSQSALRFMLDGPGASTVVDGECTTLEVGDLVLTPPMSWHDHGNEGAEPAVWLDGLDIPLVQFFDASFFERSPEPAQSRTRPPGDSFSRFGAAMRPVDYRTRSLASPIVNYPYRRARETLAALATTGEPDACHGFKLTYVNPVDGGHVLPTMAAFLQLLEPGTRTAGYRSTDATVYAVVEGRGRSIIDGTTFAWGPKDIFVVPSWMPVRHEADEQAVLFSYSDRAAQEKLGLWRESRDDR